MGSISRALTSRAPDLPLRLVHFPAPVQIMTRISNSLNSLSLSLCRVDIIPTTRPSHHTTSFSFFPSDSTRTFTNHSSHVSTTSACNRTQAWGPKGEPQPTCRWPQTQHVGSPFSGRTFCITHGQNGGHYYYNTLFRRLSEARSTTPTTRNVFQH